MPGGRTGIQIYQAIQERPAPRPALLFMSGFTNAAEFVPFLRETGTPVVAKPFDVRELCGVRSPGQLLGEAV